MQQPTLFVHVEDAALLPSIIDMARACHFAITTSNPAENWARQLLAQQCDVALIETSNLTDANYELVEKSAVLAEIEFIFISDGTPNIRLDELMHRGAGYHFRRPLDLTSISDTLEDFFYQFQQADTSVQPANSSNLDQFGLLVGSCRTMLKLYRTLRKVAVTEANVLIVGESGAGKELVANTLHLASHRVDGPFVAINCGALSPELVDSELFGHIKGAFTGAVRDHPGVFAQAEGGTLFLDEITEMPLEQQVKLLRVLENSEFRPVGSKIDHRADVRIVAATNRDPLQAVADNKLREDLYFRLAQFPLAVPPLRERGDDIIGLAFHFLAYRNAQEQQHKDIATTALAALKEYHWPGNVRQLKHTIERAFILADDVIEIEHLMLDFSGLTPDMQVPAGIPLEQLEKSAILATLAQNDGNKTSTAIQLGISVKTLYNKLERYQNDSE